MRPPASYDRVVDMMEELFKFTLLLRGRADYLIDCYGERNERAQGDRPADREAVEPVTPGGRCAPDNQGRDRWRRAFVESIHRVKATSK